MVRLVVMIAVVMRLMMMIAAVDLQTEMKRRRISFCASFCHRPCPCAVQLFSGMLLYTDIDAVMDDATVALAAAALILSFSLAIFLAAAAAAVMTM